MSKMDSKIIKNMSISKFKMKKSVSTPASRSSYTQFLHNKLVIDTIVMI